MVSRSQALASSNGGVIRCTTAKDVFPMVGLNGSPRRPRKVLLSVVVQPFGWRLSWRWIGPRCYVVAFLSGHNVLAANVFRKRCVSAVYSLVSVSHQTNALTTTTNASLSPVRKTSTQSSSRRRPTRRRRIIQHSPILHR